MAAGAIGGLCPGREAASCALVRLTYVGALVQECMHQPAGTSCMGLLPDLGTIPLPIGAQVGTAGFMSPEVARKQCQDFTSDIFSLGITLYE